MKNMKVLKNMLNYNLIKKMKIYNQQHLIYKIMKHVKNPQN